MTKGSSNSFIKLIVGSAIAVTVAGMAVKPAQADPSMIKAELGSYKGLDPEVVRFYEARGFEPLWTGYGFKDKARRTTLESHLKAAANHALPSARYQVEEKIGLLSSKEERAEAEVAFTAALLAYAQDVNTGVLSPSRVDSEIKRGKRRLNKSEVLKAATSSGFEDFLHALPPQTDQYSKLMTERLKLLSAGDVDKAKILSLSVALERERWLPRDLGDRHVIVNLPEYTTRLIDGGDVRYQTRSVIGRENTSARRTPEFSDEMEHLVINPTWHVPWSITTGEYLPRLKSDPTSVGHINLFDRAGKPVSRGDVNFSEYSAANFPYIMKQKPGRNNALGSVKFMFPNKYNIYLHDTPSRSLFAREKRAFSHGCVRLEDPHEFAYQLLESQERNPKSYFHNFLEKGYERQVNLKDHVPVHLIYRTAYIAPDQQSVEYHADIYGRDAKVWKALKSAGVGYSYSKARGIGAMSQNSKKERTSRSTSDLNTYSGR